MVHCGGVRQARSWIAPFGLMAIVQDGSAWTVGMSWGFSHPRVE